MSHEIQEGPDAGTLRILRRYMNSLAGFAGLLTTDGRVIDCNDYTAEFAGLTRDQIVGMPLWYAPWWGHSASTRRRVKQAIQRAARGSRISFEVDALSVDGHTIVVDFSLLPYLDDEGRVLYLVPHGGDVTERHVQEQELHKTYTLLRQHIDNSPMGVIEWGRDLKVVGWSGRAQDIFGWTAEEAVGRTVQELELATEEMEAAARHAIAPLLSGDGQSVIVSSQNRTKDGRQIYCRWHNTTLPSAEGPNATFLLSLVEDITQQHEAEQALARNRDDLERRVRARTYELRRSETRFQLAIEGSGEGIWSIEFGVVPPELYLAPRLYEMFQQDPEEITPDVDWVVSRIHPDERRAFMEIFSDHIMHRRPCVLAFRFEIREGVWRWFRIRGQATWSAQGRPIRMAGSVADIQAERDAAKALEETQARLIEASRSAGKSEVAAQVLHNVGNVLNSVNVSATVAMEKVQGLKVDGLLRAAQMLNEEVHADTGKLPQLLTYLNKLGDRLALDQSDLIEELRRLAKDVDHIKHVVGMQRAYARVGGVMVPTHLADLLEDALQINHTSMRRHNVTLCVEADELPEVLIERDKVLQILINLIRNAVQAMREVGDDRRLTVRLRRLEDQRCVYEVQDTGVGISAENITRIFAYGFTTKADGTGFGLHASALDAQSMEGTLTAHSQGPGHGATFRLELPLRPVDQSRAPAPALTRQITKAPI